VPVVEDAPVSINRDLTGEEAYQRRLAMSATVKPPSPPPPPAPAPVLGLFSASMTAPYHEESDDFIPGLMMSSGRVPPDAGDEAYMRRVAMSTATTLLVPPRSPSPPSLTEQESPPSSLAYNPFAPRSVPPPPPGPPGTFLPSLMEEKVKAAAAIAAKLGALAPIAGAPGQGTPAPSAPQPSDGAPSPSKK
jgi:splicing factor 45